MRESIESKKRVVFLGTETGQGYHLPLQLGERYQIEQIGSPHAFDKFLASLQKSAGGESPPDGLPNAVLVEAGADHVLQGMLERFKRELPAVPLVMLDEAGFNVEALIGMIDQAIASVAQLEMYAPSMAVHFPPLAAELPIEIHTLSNADSAAWDAFVFSHPAATFFHRAGWKRILEEVYGHQAYYLYATRGGEIAGILPLGHVKSRLFGNSLISTPFCVYGGVLADDGSVRDRLQREACDLAGRLDVDCLELRHLKPVNENWPRKDLHVTFRKTIDPDPEINMKEIPRKQRRMVRQGIEFGLVSEIDDSVERFYAAYAESVRNLGTPVHSKKYFESLQQIFGGDCEILTVTHKGQPHSSVLSFYFRDEVSPYYGGGGIEARQSHANDFMYWELMRRAAERGLKTFDFGRSKKGTGSFNFKKNWGFSEERLHYEFHLVRSQKVPDVNPLNPKYQLFIAAWKRLPLPVSKLVGPFLAKDLA